MPARIRREQLPILALPNYGPLEAALFLHVPSETLRYWISQQSGPLITLASLDPPLLSFKNLVECYVLDILRRIHKISMGKVRFSVQTIRALQQARHLTDSATPLADYDLRTYQGHLYVYDRNSKIVNLTAGGQIEWPELVEASLRRVVRDRDGVANRFFPLLKRHESFAKAVKDPQLVVVDPRISFGKPVLVGTGISTEVIAGRLTAGDPEEELAQEYGRSIEEIRAAAEFEGVAIAA